MTAFFYMAAESLNGETVGSGATVYAPLSGMLDAGGSVGSVGQILARGSYTWSKISCYVSANGTTGSSTVSAYKNTTASSNVQVSISAGGTGIFSDLTGSESVVDGDLLAHRIVNGGGGTMNFRYIATTLEGDYSICQAFETNRSITPGLTAYIPLVGSLDSLGSTTEARAQVKMYQSGTFDKLRGYMNSNASNGTTTAKFRKNGANGNQALSWATTETGAKEDASATDTVSSGDLVDYVFNNAGSSGNSVIHNIHTRLDADNVALVNVVSTNGLNANQTRYAAFVAHFNEGAGTEAYCRCPIMTAVTLSNLRGHATTNTVNGTCTVTLRVNGADNTTLQIQWPNATTGAQEDITGTVTLSATDEVNWKYTTGGSSGGWTSRVMQVNQSYSTGDNLTATGISTTPVFATPTISQTHALSATGVLVTPVLGAPTLSQIHVLDAVDISTTPILGTPSLTEEHVLDSVGISTSPSLGTPTLSQIHALNAVGISTSPSLGAPTLSQSHALNAVGISPTPVLGSPTLSEALEQLIQSHYRWFNDDGNESSATPIANEDIGISSELNATIRLRIQIDSSGNPVSNQYQLEFRKVGDSIWKAVQ